MPEPLVYLKWDQQNDHIENLKIGEQELLRCTHCVSNNNDGGYNGANVEILCGSKLHFA